MVLAFDWPTAAAWTSVLAGLLAAAVEVRAAAKAARVERVIALHRDLTAGEVGAARLRFSSYLFRVGAELGGGHVCYPPTLDELEAAMLVTPTGHLTFDIGHYPMDIMPAHEARPAADLYLVLWCFERIEAGVAGGALDDAMLAKLVAPHVVWWNHATCRITSRETRYLTSLRRLAIRLSTVELEEWAKKDFDFEFERTMRVLYHGVSDRATEASATEAPRLELVGEMNKTTPEVSEVGRQEAANGIDELPGSQ
jgi:hypothetical protein